MQIYCHASSDNLYFPVALCLRQSGRIFWRSAILGFAFLQAQRMAKLCGFKRKHVFSTVLYWIHGEKGEKWCLFIYIKSETDYCFRQVHQLRDLKVKAKIFLSSPWRYSGGIAPFILNLGTTWKWVGGRVFLYVFNQFLSKMVVLISTFLSSFCINLMWDLKYTICWYAASCNVLYMVQPFGETCRFQLHGVLLP